MDLGFTLSIAICLGIGWVCARFGRALSRGESLWPDGVALAVLVSILIAIEVTL